MVVSRQSQGTSGGPPGRNFHPGFEKRSGPIHRPHFREEDPLNMEHFEGIFFTEMWSVDGAGSFLKPGMKITTGGTTGSSLALAGYYHVASGLFDTVMTIGWEKQSEGETTAGLIFQADPLWERGTMAGAIGFFSR